MKNLSTYIDGFNARRRDDASRSWEVNLLALIGYICILIYGYKAVGWFAPDPEGATGGLWIFAIGLYLCLLLGPISRWLGSMAGLVLVLMAIVAICQGLWLGKVQTCNNFSAEMGLNEKALSLCKQNSTYRDYLGQKHNALECTNLAADYDSNPKLIERCKAVKSFRIALQEELKRSQHGGW